MKKTIYKYPLAVIDMNEMMLPVGAEILTVQAVKGDVQLWALVDPLQESFEQRYIEIFGTGHPMHCDMGIARKYISTFQLVGGDFIGHVFERLN